MVSNSCLCGRCSGAVPGLLRTRHLIPIVNNLDGLSQEHRSSRRTREAGKLGGRTLSSEVIEFVTIS
jgi:hypothetical protein